MRVFFATALFLALGTITSSCGDDSSVWDCSCTMTCDDTTEVTWSDEGLCYTDAEALDAVDNTTDVCQSDPDDDCAGEVTSCECRCTRTGDSC